MTTHSPVVIRELDVTRDELYVCRRDAPGTVSLDSLAVVPAIQGPVRNNAEAFLGSKIVACEGPTEMGCLLAYDQYRFNGGSTPVWRLATSYFNADSGGQIKVVCRALQRTAKHGIRWALTLRRLIAPAFLGGER